MKLAEALVLRADLQKRLAQLHSRMLQSVLVQEGDTPPEDPQELRAEYSRLLQELQTLIVRINKTNLQTRFDEHQTLTEALARRDILSKEYTFLHEAANTAADRTDRYGHAEIRKVATVDVAALRKQADEIARRRRELDTAIQEKNWLTELVD
ncbi:hypothetical protein EI42_03543 [Thermosporothrix hazakensis]|jgi:ElaB/YqjD/DUF883 family membrane-anchored ribosome-binding protein|uniref:Septicolysin n=2 Tax=Thermosporothrix TaxID=768650 RepID=A0A326U852_THEHA|nr:DIP1984 family protein [Thermosporothrix hazakensis]PZW27457.1 hypothetical protein EI42_03543 [Thermosporothrix hazakensis]BBH85950.1 hypothetical protein KTC_07010 [Thermosporothrix sp. COM3]GCE45623.1 hypothetical protein KTH_04920 [Thermosporothrix hazakensis]